MRLVVGVAGGIAVIALWLLGMYFLASGDPGPRGAVAVKASGEHMLVRLKACGAAPNVMSVYLTSAANVHQHLWLIESPQGSARDAYVVGDAPLDFIQSVALQTSLMPGTRYYLNATQPADRPLGLPGVVFDPGDLREDRWLVSRGRTLTDAELDHLNPCD
ncbi:MAG: hypothetical protein HY874_05415 [Chloroflexi bacterium]|nr:hypothetical protein [Chloroflexota bacterium]